MRLIIVLTVFLLTLGTTAWLNQAPLSTHLPGAQIGQPFLSQLADTSPSTSVSIMLGTGSGATTSVTSDKPRLTPSTTISSSPINPTILPSLTPAPSLVQFS